MLFRSDGARGYMVKAKLSQALDAAGLAGAKVITSGSRDADIGMYFHANFPTGYLGATVSTPTIAADAGNKNLTLSVSATLPTLFMRAVGINSITVGARAVINRVNRGMELVLVMDNTGSAGGNATLPAGLTVSATESLIVAEVYYNFSPYFFAKVAPAKVLYRPAFFRPRIGDLETIN